MKKKVTISEWLTKNFSLNVRNTESLALVASFKFNRAKVFLLFFLVFIFITTCNYFIFNFMTGYSAHTSNAEKNFKKSVLTLTYKVDSLKLEISKKDTFITQIKKVINLK